MRKVGWNSREDQKGMTLVELMIAVMILVPVLTVVLQGFVRCLEMNAVAQETSLVVWAERSKIAVIEKTPFNDIHRTYDAQTFTVSGLNGQGTVTVIESVTDPALLTVSIAYVWTGRGGRSRNVGFSTYIYNRS